MRNTLLINLLLAVLSWTLAPQAEAQDNLKRSDDFFGSDFAKSPLKDKPNAQVPVPRPGNRNNPGTKLGLPDGKAKSTPKPDSTGGGFEDIVPTEKKEPDNASLSQPVQKFERSLPVISVGAIINTADKNHATEKFSELIELSRRYKWPLGEIYSMGNIHDALSSEDLKAVYEQGGALAGYYAIPERYKSVKLSPTFIVKTSEGEVLLEATGPLKSHFNDQGQVRF